MNIDILLGLKETSHMYFQSDETQNIEFCSKIKVLFSKKKRIYLND